MTEGGSESEKILTYLYFSFKDGSGSDAKFCAFEDSIRGKSWSEILSLQQLWRISEPRQLLLMLYYIEQDPEAPPVILLDGKLVPLLDITSRTLFIGGLFAVACTAQ